MKKIFVVLVLFIFFSFLPNQSFAEEYFKTAYNVSYDVLENGLTHVTFRITLTNTSSQYYASSYKIELGFQNLQNIQASDPGGSIQPAVENSDQGKKVSLTFNKRVVGVDNSLPFAISFDTSEILQKQGTIYEINIPGLANPEKFADFTVSVHVPPSFGAPVFIKPAQATNLLTFTKDQLQKSGISIGFGSVQTYTFNLLYHLQNKNVFPIKTEIAIPPTTNYQKIYLDNVYPPPTQVIKDSDGNWLAQYYLLPSEKKEVQVRGTALLYLNPEKQPLSQKDRAQYLKAQPYWEINIAQIQELAQRLRTPRQIYTFVLQSLKYDYSRLTDNQNRLGAKGALKNPNSAVCLEFTDLFVALARAAGIPAREIDGFAYTQNSKQRPLSLVKDILHAWPEYFDDEKGTWVMVDPTWGNTTGGVDYFDTLDFDHFAFVIKGADSNYPVPAGGYKLKGHEHDKDVMVDFTKDFIVPPDKFEITPTIPSTNIAGFAIRGSIIVKNTGQGLLPSNSGTISSDLLKPKMDHFDTSDIPPYGLVTIAVFFEPKEFLTNKKATVTISLGQNQGTQTVTITPFFLLPIFIIGEFSVAGITIIIFIITTRARRVSVQKQQKRDSIRR